MSAVLERLRSALADRYAVEHEVGHGGMATVYRAQDLKHRRPVAIKVLKPELAAALGPDRFLREIEIVARLTHPHILPLYDSGDAAGLLYYVMPFVEGDTLRGRLDRGAPLPLDEALRITRELADALHYAHGQGLVHRDVKPENVLFVTGHAVLSDFGIARAVSAAAAGRNLTEAGMSVGTPRYMSPEQAFGTELDARSDVYSLGCVLYEMLAGRAPFDGPTAQSIFAQAVTESPAHLPDNVPHGIAQTVLKALARAPADRFESAAAFAQALQAPPAPPSGAGAAKSIAVLPFVNMSADPENEYFTDGIAEEIINALTKVQALRVAARTSAFAFKGKNLDIRRVGEQLNVATVLEGSVRKAGTRLRVMAQLINVADGYHLWSERYDRELADVFAIQDEIAGNIVRALRVVLSETEKRAIERAPAADVQAYEYYLRARQAFHQMRRTSIQFARRMFERAIAIDPQYALAYAGVADCCAFLYMYWDGSKANLEGADAASRQALALGPNLAEAHASRGFALSLSRQHGEARAELETALRLDPQLYDAHYYYARTCFQEGQLDEAVRHYEDAARVRPEDYQALLLMTSPLKGLGRLAEAADAQRRGLQAAERHLALNPDDARALYLGAGALIQAGDTARGREWIQRARAIDPHDPAVLYNVACCYAILGEVDEAIACLETAVQNGFGHREWFENDSDLDVLRGEPRFQALMRKL